MWFALATSGVTWQELFDTTGAPGPSQGASTPATAVQGALGPMPEIAGVASAVLSGLQMLAAAGASALVAALFDGRSALAMTGVMALCAAGAAATYAIVVRPAERGRAAGAAAAR